MVFRAPLQFMSQYIEKHFRIGIGIDVTQILPKQLLIKLGCIGEIAVMPEHDSERRIDIERLCLGW